MDFSKEEPNLPSDSDDSDGDYIPSDAESNPPSEVESDGDDEDPPESDEDDPSAKKRKRGQKVSKKKARKKSRKSALVEDEESEEKVGDDEKKILTDEEERKRADSLWADFKSDTKPAKPQSKKTIINSKNEEKEDKVAKEKVEPKKEEKENKVTITEIFEFAGEEVKVTKEVDSASKETRNIQTAPKAVGSGPSGPPAGRGKGRASGGLSSILGQIGKKSKLGTLEKSKLDWDHFKKAEGIEDELKTFNRGKDGYLEKQDFLERTDLRQFEIEKGLRATRRSNR